MSTAADQLAEISPERVRHVAMLARLELTEADAAKFSRELSNVITHINKLGELDLKDVPPTSHALPVSNVFRDDVPAPSLSNDDVLANAPEREGACFKVPQII